MLAGVYRGKTVCHVTRTRDHRARSVCNIRATKKLPVSWPHRC